MLIDHFIDRAKEYIRLAERTKSARDREFFVKMARAWYGIAEQDVDIRRSL